MQSPGRQRLRLSLFTGGFGFRKSLSIREVSSELSFTHILSQRTAADRVNRFLMSIPGRHQISRTDVFAVCTHTRYMDMLTAMMMSTCRPVARPANCRYWTFVEEPAERLGTAFALRLLLLPVTSSAPGALDFHTLLRSVPSVQATSSCASEIPCIIPRGQLKIP